MKASHYFKALLLSSLLLSGCAGKETTPQESVVVQQDQAIVEVEGGKLRGYIDNGVYTYKGIHYATAKRFEEPQKVASWDGIKDVMVYGDMCPQADMSAGLAEMINPHLFWPEAKDETQIQTLNIWSTDIHAKEKKPVMVWIHGGGFSSGASTEQIAYDGRNLSERGDVVVVSLTHRLNVLGYLDLSEYGEEYQYSGNLGQMDIVAALEWVQENIAQFGGDPSNVTIFGQSGGGRKVLNLMGTPSAKGLFHKAIGESCGQQSNTHEDAALVAQLTLQNLGIDPSEVDKIKEVDYDTLLQAGNAALKESGIKGMNWAPVVDGDFMPKDIWLDDQLADESKDVPLMIGSTFAERTTNAFGFVLGNAQDKSALSKAQVDEILSTTYGEQKDAVVAAFKKAYPDKPIIDAAYYDVNAYRLSVLDVANKKAAQGGANVYNYLFALEFPTMGGWLPWHCSEIPFVFHNVDLVKETFSLEEKVLHMQDMMCDAWINFAKTGNPNHQGMIEWPAYTQENGSAMIFDEKSFIGEHHDQELIQEILKATAK